MTMQMIRPLAIGIAVLFAVEGAAQEAAETAAVPEETAEEITVTPETAVAVWQENPQRIFDTSEVDLDDFRWIARPLVVFGESPFDPNFQSQMELLADRPSELVERDVIIIVDTDPDTLSDIRRQLRPRSFMLALIGKDGQVKLRKPLPWDLRELSRSIDKMPLRQQEIADRRGS